MDQPIDYVVFGEGGQTFYDVSIKWTRPGKLNQLASRSQAANRYLFILQVRDYVRLADRDPTTGLLSALDEDTIRDAKAGRCLVLLDLSNEGPRFDKALFDALHQALAARGLPFKAILFLNQNRQLDRDYASIYGSGIQFASHDFFVKMLCVTLDAKYSRLFGNANELAAFEPSPNADARDFLCLNATPRWHRILLYRHLCISGLLERGLVSFHGANPSNPKATSLDYSTIPANLPNDFAELVDKIEDWMPTQAVRFDTSEKAGNDLAQTLESWAYKATRYSIVTESDFFEGDVERITEKSIKAAGLGHPFIIAGNPRSVSFLSELGFDTFSGLIDHAYDREINNNARMRLIFREVARQQQRLKQDRSRWAADAKESSLHNFRFARDGLLARFERLVEDPVLSRLKRFIQVGSL